MMSQDVASGDKFASPTGEAHDPEGEEENDGRVENSIRAHKRSRHYARACGIARGELEIHD